MLDRARRRTTACSTPALLTRPPRAVRERQLPRVPDRRSQRRRLAPLFADGEFKTELEASPPPASDSGDTSRSQIQGFKIDSYSANEATVDLAIQYTGGANDGQLLSLPVVVKWEDGDWKVFISSNGAPVAPTTLSSLGGYIPFSGV